MKCKPHGWSTHQLPYKTSVTNNTDVFLLQVTAAPSNPTATATATATPTPTRNMTPPKPNKIPAYFKVTMLKIFCHERKPISSPIHIPKLYYVFGAAAVGDSTSTRAAEPRLTTYRLK